MTLLIKVVGGNQHYKNGQKIVFDIICDKMGQKLQWLLEYFITYCICS